MNRILPWYLSLWTQVLLAVLLVSAAQAQSPKHLWVLQEPDQIVEYDLATFAARRTLKVPRRLIEHPEYLSVNAKGQMVFLPPKGAQWGSGEMASAGDRLWFWDGHRAKERNLEGAKTLGAARTNPPSLKRRFSGFFRREGSPFSGSKTSSRRLRMRPGWNSPCVPAQGSGAPTSPGANLRR